METLDLTVRLRRTSEGRWVADWGSTTGGIEASAEDALTQIGFEIDSWYEEED